MEGKSKPCARPHAVTTPPYFVVAQIFAKVWLPTESMAPAHNSFPNGLPFSDNSDLLIIFFAPNEFI